VLADITLKENVPDWPLFNAPTSTDGYPAHEDGTELSGTKHKTTLFQLVPVDWPTVAVKVVPYAIGPLHKNPDEATHVVPTRELLLNMPRENNAARTIAMMRIAQPYVIRYSIALCAFNSILVKQTTKFTIRIID